MSQAVYAKVIRRLSTTYGAPNTFDQEALYEEFCKALKGYSEHLLEKAMDKVIRERTFAGWPVVGEVVEAAKAVAAANVGSPPEHVKFAADPTPEKKLVDPEKVKSLLSAFTASLGSNNDFPAIIDRCPIGGTVNVSAPWGEEVRDKDGNIVPIQRKKKGAA